MKKNKNIINDLVCLVGAIITSILLLYAMFTLIVELQAIKNNANNINEPITNSEYPLIDKIAEDCGSTFIVKPYGNDSWHVFKQVCNPDGYCKYESIPLEVCLK